MHYFQCQLYFLQDAGLQFNPKPKSWIDALKDCLNQNSILVQITNQTVQDAVNLLLLNNTASMQNGSWIGLERSIFGQNPPWKWTSGLKANQTGTPPWNSSAPVDAFNNHCGKIISVNGSNFTWLDANCHEKLPYICQVSNGTSFLDTSTSPENCPDD